MVQEEGLQAEVLVAEVEDLGKKIGAYKTEFFYKIGNGTSAIIGRLIFEGVCSQIFIIGARGY